MPHTIRVHVHTDDGARIINAIGLGATAHDLCGTGVRDGSVDPVAQGEAVSHFA